MLTPEFVDIARACSSVNAISDPAVSRWTIRAARIASNGVDTVDGAKSLPKTIGACLEKTRDGTPRSDAEPENGITAGVVIDRHSGARELGDVVVGDSAGVHHGAARVEDPGVEEPLRRCATLRQIMRTYGLWCHVSVHVGGDVVIGGESADALEEGVGTGQRFDAGQGWADACVGGAVDALDDGARRVQYLRRVRLLDDFACGGVPLVGKAGTCRGPDAYIASGVCHPGH
ncbi:hypothetical protein ASG12_08715 [Williamsia sp. Leaf354]|nr:hypothetical protein [Williamsia sp. Leaf354]KQR98511.1 hypothetical protein ASG12_08715 [Williamsia sp. Leaf354]